MPHTLFISDLHLCDSRPHTVQAFQHFLHESATEAEALYILGDLFEYWVGDDDLADPRHDAIIAALAGLSKSGVRLYVMHGNRDLLLSDAFTHACGATLLTDPILVSLYGKRMLLTHGDALCTDDTAYQQFRHQVRDPATQRAFLDQPLAVRKARIENMRAQSEQEKSYKTESIMDVNADAVHDLLRRHHYPELLIHGHTHRPSVHDILCDGHVCQRWVLGDWFDHANSLRCDASGCAWQAIA